MSVAESQAEPADQDSDNQDSERDPEGSLMARGATRYPCPTCGKDKVFHLERDMEDFPFCSARCKTIDLGGWLSDDDSDDDFEDDDSDDSFEPDESDEDDWRS